MALVRTALAAPANTSFNSLANSLTAVASSFAIAVGTTTNVVDHQVAVTISVAAITTPSASTVINLYVYGSIDGTTYSGTTVTNELVDGTDKALTWSANGTEAIYLGTISCNNAAAAVYKSKLLSVASAFGGVLPAKYVIVAQNQSTSAFAATGNSVAVTEISYS